MKTTTVPEIVFHIFIANNASLVEKYNPFLLQKQYLIDVKQKIIYIKKSMLNAVVVFFFYNIAILPGSSLKIEP